MSTTTRSKPRSRRPASPSPRSIGAVPATAPVPKLARPVLVALDGSRPSNAALRFARRMAQRGAWAPDAVTVAEPLPMYVGDMLLPAPPWNESAASNSILLGIRTQLRRHGLPGWRAEVRFGPTAASIMDAANDAHARMIVLGLGKHARIARLFGAETVARVARNATVPVLAVHASTRGLPRIAVVAVDFGSSSIRAVHEALALLDAPAELHLVHVMGKWNFTEFDDSAWRAAYADATQASFDRLIKHLPIPAGVTVTTELLQGQVIENVVRYARTARADLVAMGSHNQNVLDRIMIGSTPAQLLRIARWAVLIAPPSTPTP
jgi:nucleotide-binding universal stress UspA family protein